MAEFVVPSPFEGVALYALLTIGFAGIGWRMLRPADLDAAAHRASAESVDV